MVLMSQYRTISLQIGPSEKFKIYLILEIRYIIKRSNECSTDSL